MPNRIRHCVECPKCLTRYLFSGTPYPNGSYLVPTSPHLSDEYTLYCSCRRPAVASCWRSSEVKTCTVASSAYRRGYGTREEIVILRSRASALPALDVAKYFDSEEEQERSSHEQEGSA